MQLQQMLMIHRHHRHRHHSLVGSVAVGPLVRSGMTVADLCIITIAVCRMNEKEIQNRVKKRARESADINDMRNEIKERKTNENDCAAIYSSDAGALPQINIT